MDLGERIETLRFLIDRNPLFIAAFGEVFKAEELRIVTTLPKTPRMNAVCARVIGTLRRELLDRLLVLREYLIHYNRHRPHQSRHQRPPDTEAQPLQGAAGPIDLHRIRRKPVVAGLINEYHDAA
ncbi:hypothetical protein GCM10023191_067180 [Actinoallomurus oryzae]|uniref:Integrase catalytic domain-containing protein n=1 Tax=Actinoallomurus oryzae TaxID=502180 RepID=A0ABP8QT35_9ACTN